MKQFIVILLGLVIFSCGKEAKHDFTLKGSVKGLKKGTVYLQKQKDTLMVTLDSMEVNGSSNFELHTNLTEPEVLFLKLDKNDNEDGTVVFFADKGITEIHTTLKNFNVDATIKGSKQQEVLDEYLLMMSKFSDRNLELIEESLTSQKAKDSIATELVQGKFDNLVKQKYLYTINFAVNHPDSEVAPYLAISEVSNTSVKFLEDIYTALTDDIKASKYGKQLKAYIEARKQD